MTASSTGRHVDDTDTACLYPTTHLLQYLTMFSDHIIIIIIIIIVIVIVIIVIIIIIIILFCRTNFTPPFDQACQLNKKNYPKKPRCFVVLLAFPGMVIASKNGALSSRVLRSWGREGTFIGWGWDLFWKAKERNGWLYLNCFGDMPHV